MQRWREERWCVFMAQNQILDKRLDNNEKRKEYISHCYHVLQSFDRLGYSFEESLSSKTQLVFSSKVVSIKTIRILILILSVIIVLVE